MTEQTKFFYQETRKHQNSVNQKMTSIILKLIERASKHDNSKFSNKESELFIELTPKLKKSTYGSEEYKQFLQELKPALEHHYACNSHHPEHFSGGIKEMSLVDLIEMICDWYAATERHDDGNIFRSIEINQKRFGYSDELKSILINTIIREFPDSDMCATNEGDNE